MPRIAASITDGVPVDLREGIWSASSSRRPPGLARRTRGRDIPALLAVAHPFPLAGHIKANDCDKH